MFLCPICAKELSKCENTLKCASNHSFDYSKSGYVNLLNPGKMNNAKAGDSKEMIRARSSFFESGAYSKIKDTICNICSELGGSLIIDAGCGEGYYTEGVAFSSQNATVIGFDMSKLGCEHGSKHAKKREVENVLYAVSSIFEMPIADNSADIIVNMFAPVADKEFSRVLSPNGYLIVGSARISHLDGLKAKIYDISYPNEEKFLEYEDFELITTKRLKYSAKITDNDTIYSLFTMTPYFHRTSLTDKEKLKEVSEIQTTIEVNFTIYKKK
jgi:23S rRNA (guanine745-N1)-methyltransferase